MALKAEFSPKVKANLIKKYGDKVYILNEHLNDTPELEEENVNNEVIAFKS